jgi:ABC-type Fe3+/spermidine/putrescine transport system ATPase subunit
MLSIDTVTKRFDGHQAVAGASLELARGETLALLGPSGCGKTTLLRLLAGFERPDSGYILLDGKDIAALPPSRRNIGLVFQDYALFPHMTVGANIEYGLRRRGIRRAERVARLAEMLALVRLEGLGARFPAALSGGQQQRVALARALAIRPPLLLLDEPLSNLDAKLRVELANELRATLLAANTTRPRP